MKNLKGYLLLLATVLAASSCSGDKEDVVGPRDRNTINYIVRDNFNLKILAASMYASGMEPELAKPGPLTLLAPSDAAYIAAGYENQAAIVAVPVADLAARNAYHLLPDVLQISDQPLGMNQPHSTRSGKPAFLSRVIKGIDTINTINGARVLQTDATASNGNMQVINRYLEPLVFDKLGDAISANPGLSLFYQALQRSGLIEQLNGAGSFTIFAPNNAAMQAQGYPDVLAIEAADPAVLSSLLKYHIANDRKFAQDYFLLAATDQTTYAQTMLDGRILTVNLLTQSGVPNSFTGITLKGITVTTNRTPVQTDILSGNGVIHIIGQILK